MTYRMNSVLIEHNILMDASKRMREQRAAWDIIKKFVAMGADEDIPLVIEAVERTWALRDKKAQGILDRVARGN